MTELTVSETVHPMYIAPIWRKPRRIKSFKQAAEFVVKAIQLGLCVKPSNRSIEFIYEQLKASESMMKKRRLHDLKCLARYKNADFLPDEVQERRQHFFKVFRKKFRQLKLLEQMNRYSRKHCSEKPTNDTTCFGKIRQFESERREQRSPFLPGKVNSRAEVRAIMSTPNPALHKRRLQVATNTTVATENRRTQTSFSTERSERCLMASSASPKYYKYEEQPSMDGMRDPRFQNLIRSLTPIDC